jgi:hypothetical protein
MSQRRLHETTALTPDEPHRASYQERSPSQRNRPNDSHAYDCHQGPHDALSPARAYARARENPVHGGSCLQVSAQLIH